MAPEVAQCVPYGTAADVYSFAMLLYYMASRTRPFLDWAEAELRAAVAEGTRPPLPRGWPSSLCCLVEACWHPLAVERPAFDEILPRLTAISQEVASISVSPSAISAGSSTFARVTSKLASALPSPPGSPQLLRRPLASSKLGGALSSPRPSPPASPQVLRRPQTSQQTISPETISHKAGLQPAVQAISLDENGPQAVRGSRSLLGRKSQDSPLGSPLQPPLRTPAQESLLCLPPIEPVL